MTPPPGVGHERTEGLDEFGVDLTCGANRADLCRDVRLEEGDEPGNPTFDDDLDHQVGGGQADLGTGVRRVVDLGDEDLGVGQFLFRVPADP